MILTAPFTQRSLLGTGNAGNARNAGGAGGAERHRAVPYGGDWGVGG